MIETPPSLAVQGHLGLKGVSKLKQPIWNGFGGDLIEKVLETSAERRLGGKVVRLKTTATTRRRTLKHCHSDPIDVARHVAPVRLRSKLDRSRPDENPVARTASAQSLITRA